MNKVQREKLLFALQLHDMVGGINYLLTKHKGWLRIDYTDSVVPKLMLDVEGLAQECLGFLDTRRRIYYKRALLNPHLAQVWSEIQDMLTEYDAVLTLTSKQPKQGKRLALLQVQISHASAVSLTLMGVAKGKSISDNVFQLPDGETP